MADMTDEIDDFAIFRARSMGVESEYMILAKAGQLRGNPRHQRETKSSDPDENDQSPSRRRHASGGRQRNAHPNRSGDEGQCESPSSLGEGFCSPKVRRAVPYTRSDSTKTETLETRNELFPLEEEGRLHRAHSYRSRRSPQPHGSQVLLGPNSDQSESKFNRSRTMTMPARRRPVAGKAVKADCGTGSEPSPPRRPVAAWSRSSFRGEADANGNRASSPGEVVMDRAVLRVRNFSTKSGSIVNRGDSIKVRGGRSEIRQGSAHARNSGGLSRPPSLRNENGGIGEHEAPLASPSTVRPSLSRHSSRGSYKYPPEPEFIMSPEGGGVSGGWGGGVLLSSPTPSAHNLLSPIGYPLSDVYVEDSQAPDDGAVMSHLEVNSAQCLSDRGQKTPLVVKPDVAPDEDMVVYKVLVLGSQGVGKTTLTKQLLTSEYLANNENDIDDETADKIVSVQVDDEESMLQFIDGSGSQPNKDKDTADANIVVYSVTDRVSFNYAQSCLQELRPAKRHNVVILIANKQDIVRNRIISEEDGKSLAAKRHCKFIEVSALLNHKTDDLLVGITRQIRLRKARNSSNNPPGSNEAPSPDRGGPVGCLQRVAMEAFRKIFKRRVVESTSCDDLFTP